MRKYLAITVTAFKSQIIWRFDAFLRAALSAFRVIFAFVLWSAIYEGRVDVGGLTMNGMMTYYILAGLLSQLDRSGTVSGEVQDRIRDGTFTKYMVIPVSPQGYFIAQEAGVTAFNLLFSVAASALWTVLFGVRLTFTSDGIVLLAAGCMTALGLLFMTQFNYFLGLLVLKFENVGIFLIIKSNLCSLLTGDLIPLMLLPAALVGAFRFLPFYYVTYLPAMLFMGRNTGEAAVGLCVIAAWVVFFSFLNPYAYKKLRLRYEGVGV